MERGRHGVGISAERLALIRERLDDGWSWRQIQQTHGVSYGTLRRHFPGTSMDLREAARLGAAARRASLRLTRAR